MNRIIFSTTPFAKYLRHVMEEDGQGPIAAFCANREYIQSDTFDGLPLLAFEALDDICGKGNFEILIAVGYSHMNTGRQRLFAQCDARGYTIGSFIHSGAELHGAKPGRGCLIMNHCVLHPFVTMGEGNILNETSVLGHETRMGDFNFVASCTTGGLASIGNNCFLGMKCVINDNVRVGDYNILGAGVVLTKDTEPYTVTMPAKNRTMTADIDTLGELLMK